MIEIPLKFASGEVPIRKEASIPGLQMGHPLGPDPIHQAHPVPAVSCARRRILDSAGVLLISAEILQWTPATWTAWSTASTARSAMPTRPESGN